MAGTTQSPASCMYTTALTTSQSDSKYLSLYYGKHSVAHSTTSCIHEIFSGRPISRQQATYMYTNVQLCTSALFCGNLFRIGKQEQRAKSGGQCCSHAYSTLVRSGACVTIFHRSVDFSNIVRVCCLSAFSFVSRTAVPSASLVKILGDEWAQRIFHRNFFVQ